ncbi:MAG: hypothetical protein IJA86_05450 [Clostridia bacterium]|nr:hypothetical protein [Clostridia bacterium]
MKKRIAFLIILFLSLLFASCAGKPNMEALLSYQRPGTVCALRITDGEVFYAQLRIEEKEMRIIFTDEKREGLSYRLKNDGTLSLFFEETEIPLASSELIKCKRWFSAFSVSAGENIWKIKKETLGGISLYICKDSVFTLYIDAVSGLPLKIEVGNMTVDVLSCSIVES